MKFFKLSLITISCFLLTVLPIPVEANTSTQRYIVTFEDKVEEELIEKSKGKLVKEFETVPVVAASLTSQAVKEMENNSQVKSIEKDEMFRISYQRQEWGIAAINAPMAWKSNYSGSGIKIAVIDTGISPHLDLEIAGGISYVDYTSSYYDDNGHGTHVAGIIGALNNDYGIRGVASDATIYSVKALSHEGTGYVSNIIASLDWAIQNEMDIVNISIGIQTDSPALKAIIEKAYSKGILLVAAAGNDGNEMGLGDSIDFPAKYDQVIAVGAIDQFNKRASFSSTGSDLEVTAPGLNILSTSLNGNYAEMSGTSMAAPFVTGQLAIIKQAYPTLTNDQIRSILSENTLDLGEIGKDPQYGKGLIQASDYLSPKYFTFSTANPMTRLEVSEHDVKGVSGSSKQTKAEMILKNGTRIDVTKESIWKSNNESITRIVGGNLTFIQAGKTTILVSFQGYSNLIQIETVSSLPSTSKVSENIKPRVSIIWGKSTLVEGQIGRVNLVKNAVLYKMENNKLIKTNLLRKNGSFYRVYGIIGSGNKQFLNVGGGYYLHRTTATNYETPSIKKKEQLFQHLSKLEAKRIKE